MTCTSTNIISSLLYALRSLAIVIDVPYIIKLKERICSPRRGDAREVKRDVSKPQKAGEDVPLHRLRNQVGRRRGREWKAKSNGLCADALPVGVEAGRANDTALGRARIGLWDWSVKILGVASAEAIMTHPIEEGAAVVEFEQIERLDP